MQDVRPVACSCQGHSSQPHNPNLGRYREILKNADSARVFEGRRAGIDTAFEIVGSFLRLLLGSARAGSRENLGTWQTEMVKRLLFHIAG